MLVSRTSPVGSPVGAGIGSAGSSGRPLSSQHDVQEEHADKEQRRNIINSEFIVFYGYDVDGVSLVYISFL